VRLKGPKNPSDRVLLILLTVFVPEPLTKRKNGTIRRKNLRKTLKKFVSTA
jgi:hypothetical protein